MRGLAWRRLRRQDTHQLFPKHVPTVLVDAAPIRGHS